MADVTARTDASHLDGPPDGGPPRQDPPLSGRAVPSAAVPSAAVPHAAVPSAAVPHAHVDAHLQADLGAGADVGTGHVEVDLDAVAGNVDSMARRTGTPVLAVVKADAYGHGLVPVARAALAGGAAWLGVAQLDEALRLREAGIDAPVLAWLLSGDAAPVAAALRRQVTLGLSHPRHVEAVMLAARASGQVADVHVKVDTGLHRNGVDLADLPAVARTLADAERAGLVSVSGVFSHLAWADSPRHPTVDRQAAAFTGAVDVLREAGLRPGLRHLANSAATLTRPDLHLDLVRPGLAVYGLSPVPDIAGPAELGLRPALTLRSRLAHVRRLAAGEGVSYGHAWTATEDTVLGLVPLGYADGLPRSATGRAEVWVGGSRGRRVPVVGRICMDQVVVDLGARAREDVGDDVVVLGPGLQGEPTAEEWAVAAGTISYEVVARLGSRLPRRWLGAGDVALLEDEPALLDLGDGGTVVTDSTPWRLIGLGAGLAAAGAGVAAGITADRLRSRRRDVDAVFDREGLALLGRVHGEEYELHTDDGVRLHVEVDEPGPREADRTPEMTVVLVHGYGLSSQSWHFQRLALRGRYRVVTYDQRGHGRSEVGPGGRLADHAAGRRPGRGPAGLRPRGSGGPGRALHGRHDDDEPGAPAAGAVRHEGARGRPGRHERR